MHRIAAVLTALALLTCGARTAVPAQPRALNVAQLIEPKSLTPTIMTTLPEGDVTNLLFDGLIRIDEHGRAVPDLALEVPTRANGGISADGKTLTYHLAPNARWHDGVPVTAADVVFTWRAIMNPSTLVATRDGYDHISEVRALDAHTVQVRFPRAYAPAIYLFSAGITGAIVPQHLLGRFHDLNRVAFSTNPVGSGPYRFVSWRHGDRIELTANEGYFRGRPSIERIVLHFILQIGASFAMKDTSWAGGLEVTADGKGLVGHGGAIILRQLADRLGLTSALEKALTMKGTFPQLSRGMVLVSTAIAIALGATAMADIQVLDQLAPVLGTAPSDSTVRRVLDLATDQALTRIAQARARIRKHAWKLIEEAGGFPWITVAGKTLQGWLVIDMDATLITAHSDKENAKPTWKMGYGFHPLGAWLANTRECLAMLLRPGNAGSNTFKDHKEVLTAAIKQVPASFRKKILIRLDGAGASHDLVKHLLSLSTRRMTVLFTCGWTILDSDEAAIAALPESAWQPGLLQDGGLEDDKDCAEITHLMARAGDWPDGLRFIARRVKPSRRHKKNMTAFEKKTGWKYSITCTNIDCTGMKDVPGSQHPQFIDVLQRDHATVETDGVRTAKAMGLRNLPSKDWQVNKGWVLAANIAADLTAWARLLGLHDQEGLRDATPDTLRYRLWSIPARLVRHARKRTLKISPGWPWKEAFLTCWQRTCAIPAPS